MPDEFKHVVRLANRDLNGFDQTYFALQKIKGIGFNTAIAICRLTNIDPYRRLGSLSEQEIKNLENTIFTLHEKVPSWFLNRPKDPETGKNLHYLESDLILKVREDIEKMKAMKSWKGIRHAAGLKVRGQSTRTTGRTGLTVGVTKKAEQ
jgi:small subunit ribosomal protein S13